MTTTRKLHYKSINADASTYIGEPGCIFFDPATNTLRVGDGTTPGGLAVTLDIGLATSQDILNVQTHLDASIAVVISGLGNLATASGLSAARSDITSILGTGFVAGTDDLHALHTVVSSIQSSVNNMSSGTSLAAVQTYLDASIGAGVVGLATATNLSTLQTTVNDIQSSVNAIKTHLGI